MAMTKYEHSARDYVTDSLAKQGYKTYAILLQGLDFHLTEDPNTVGYLDTRDGSITINKNLYIDQMSTVIRHEILHEALAHAARQLDIIKRGGKFSNVTHDLFNIAADFEISNLGYTDDDKRITRNIVLNGKTLKGLVTEDNFPDWTDMSFEEMVEQLVDQQEEIYQVLQQQLEDMSSEPNPAVQDLERTIRQLEKALENAEEEAKENQEAAEAADSQEAEENHEEEAKEAKTTAELIKKLEKKAERLKNSLKKLGKSETSFEKEKEEEKEAAERVATFKKLLEHPRLTNVLRDETKRRDARNRALKREREVSNYRKSPIAQFEISLINFIKKAIGVGRDSTWKRLNLKYDSDEIVKPGRMRSTNKKIPVINVYFDRSGSFSSYPNKTKAAESVISLLDSYVRQGKLKVNLYYATNDVYEDRKVAERIGMGMDAPPVIRHIKKTQPDNVIILTDSDSGNRGGDSVVVPGGAWILFFESTSDLHEYVKGELETQVYKVD